MTPVPVKVSLPDGSCGKSSLIKRCPRCGVTKAGNEFSPDRSHASGLASRCKACVRDISKKRYDRDGGRKAAEYYARNRGRKKEQAAARYARTRDVLPSRWTRERASAIEVYGGRCERCGDTELLQFDHVDNNGGEHGKVESHQAMVRRIAESGRRLDDWRLQLLCRWHHRRRTAEVAAQVALLRALSAAAVRVFAQSRA
jgi:hypothetical protein